MDLHPKWLEVGVLMDDVPRPAFRRRPEHLAIRARELPLAHGLPLGIHGACKEAFVFRGIFCARDPEVDHGAWRIVCLVGLDVHTHARAKRVGAGVLCAAHPVHVPT